MSATFLNRCQHRFLVKSTRRSCERQSSAFGASPPGFISRLAYDLENFISPALAALILLAASWQALFVGTVISFIAPAMVILNTVALVQEQFGLTEQHSAMAFTVFGCGSMMAAMVLPTLPKRWQDRQVVVAWIDCRYAGHIVGPGQPCAHCTGSGHQVVAS